MNQHVIQDGRGPEELSGFMRMTALLVTAVFTLVTIEPAMAALRMDYQQRQQAAAVHPAFTASALDEWRDELVSELKSVSAADEQAGRPSSMQLSPSEHLARLDDQVAELRRDFRRVEEFIEVRRLPEIAERRHREARREFDRQVNTLREQLVEYSRAAPGRDRQAAALDLLDQLQKAVPEPRHQDIDPNNLPFGAPSGEVREARTHAEDLRAVTRYAPEGYEESTSGDDEELATLDVRSSGVGQNALRGRDEAFEAALDRILAEQGEDPLSLYDWVRNNITWVPSYGVIQGPAMTLELRQGNAFDTAQLLNALLERAGVESRYVYGTIQVPATKAQNWVGGVETPGAAARLMGQGGIPVTQLVSGGKVSHLQIEHLWVEAKVDYEPSFGAVHSEGDAWIPLDPSYKQYEHAPALDMESDVPFDAEAFAETVRDQAEIDEDAGWVRNIDQDQIQSELEAYREQVESHIEGLFDDPAVGDVLGSSIIERYHPRVLPATLPYTVVEHGERLGDIPSHLHWQFRHEVLDQYGMVQSSWAGKTTQVAGREVAYSYRPSTDSDTETLASFLPEVEDGEELDPEDLPDSIPGYLVNVTGELTIDGEVVNTTASRQMGANVTTRMGYWSPAHGWKTRKHEGTAGEYQAIGLDLQGVSQDQLGRIQDRLTRAREKLETSDFDNLLRHDLTGAILQSGVTGFFAINDVQDYIAGRVADTVPFRMPSFGIFKTQLQTEYYFGVPRNVSFPGVVMDIQHYLIAAEPASGTDEAQIAFHRSVGPRISALEHIVPEELFGTEEDPVEGISAVKALGVASAQGQRIYQVTEENLDAALSQVNADSGVISDIRASVRAGKEVTVHQDEIQHAGWQGTGYIVIDPESGTGAYKISGGANGGFLEKLSSLLSWVAFMAEALFEILKDAGSQLYKQVMKRVDAAVDLIRLILNCGLLVGGIVALAVAVIVAKLALIVAAKALFILYLTGSALAAGLTALLGSFLSSLLASKIVSSTVEGCRG